MPNFATELETFINTMKDIPNEQDLKRQLDLEQLKGEERDCNKINTHKNKKKKADKLYDIAVLYSYCGNALYQHQVTDAAMNAQFLEYVQKCFEQAILVALEAKALYSNKAAQQTQEKINEFNVSLQYIKEQAELDTPIEPSPKKARTTEPVHVIEDDIEEIAGRLLTISNDNVQRLYSDTTIAAYHLLSFADERIVTPEVATEDAQQFTLSTFSTAK